MLFSLYLVPLNYFLIQVPLLFVHRERSSALVYVLAGCEISLKQLRLKKIKATESLPTGEWTDWVPLAVSTVGTSPRLIFMVN